MTLLVGMTDRGWPAGTNHISELDGDDKWWRRQLHVNTDNDLASWPTRWRLTLLTTQ